MTIAEARRRVSRAVDAFPEIRREAAEEMAPDVVAANRAQLMEEKDADGRDISPGYSLFTRRTKQSKGQPTDRVTLFDTGVFQEGMFAEADGDKLVIDSRDGKSASLKEKYGDRIFGIGREQSENLKRISVHIITNKIKEITRF